MKFDPIHEPYAWRQTIIGVASHIPSGDLISMEGNAIQPWDRLV